METIWAYIDILIIGIRASGYTSRSASIHKEHTCSVTSGYIDA